MRIIAGEFKGRKIRQPASGALRPTKDRIREAVFNVIAGSVPGANVLDIFAGSGAYGLEALSRGAEKVVFVERDRQCNRAIMENIQLLGLEERTGVVRGDVFKSVRLFGKEQRRFDLIFSDPPYGKGMAKKTLIMINHYDILNPTGLLIIEHYRTEELPEAERGLSVFKQKTYGDIFVSFFRKNDQKSSLSRHI